MKTFLTGIDPPFEVQQIPVDCQQVGLKNDFDFLPKGIDQLDNADFDCPSRLVLALVLVTMKPLG